MRGSSVVLSMCALAGVLATSGAVTAQEATPAARPERATIEPCTAEPRPVDELLAIWFDASGAVLTTPAPPEPIPDFSSLPEGSGVDETTLAAIIETTQNWISCIEYSSQPVRGFSYMTDRFLTQFGPDASDPAQDTPDELRALLEEQFIGTPVVPSSGEVASPLLGPRRERVLDDGRVGAVWSLGGNRFFFIYTQVDGRWLIDDAIAILEPAGTPVAGTPAATPPA
jgi:hypothetical protein